MGHRMTAFIRRNKIKKAVDATVQRLEVVSSKRAVKLLKGDVVQYMALAGHKWDEIIEQRSLTYSTLISSIYGDIKSIRMDIRSKIPHRGGITYHDFRGRDVSATAKLSKLEEIFGNREAVHSIYDLRLEAEKASREWKKLLLAGNGPTRY